MTVTVKRARRRGDVYIITLAPRFMSTRFAAVVLNYIANVKDADTGAPVFDVLWYTHTPGSTSPVAEFCVRCPDDPGTGYSSIHLGLVPFLLRVPIYQPLQWRVDVTGSCNQ
jgi:hypothetical protein